MKEDELYRNLKVMDAKRLINTFIQSDEKVDVETYIALFIVGM